MIDRKVSFYIGSSWKDCFTDYHLTLLRKTIEAPEVKTATVDIPLTDGQVDLLASLSSVPRYNNRTITMEFELIRDRWNWVADYQAIMAALHGQALNIRFSDDTSYYWTGRISVGALEDHGTTAGLVITMDAKPFKRTTTKTTAISQRTVNSSYSTTVTISSERAYPIFTVSGAMTVSDGTDTYSLSSTRSTAYGLELKKGSNSLSFTAVGGSKTLKMEYEGGML